MHTSSNASRRLVINNNTAAFYRIPSAYKHYYYSLVLAERLKSLETTDPVDTTDKAGGSVAEMYGASGIPELIPPSGPPRQAGPAGQYNPGHPQVNGHGGEANPQRLGQRAPKLGQIGRSKKVDLEDEDLEDIMNNNGQCQVSLAPCS